MSVRTPFHCCCGADPCSPPSIPPTPTPVPPISPGRWAAEPLPALATLDLELDGAAGPVEAARRLPPGAAGGERGSCSETVACMPGSSTPLPLGVSKRLGDWEYEFAARVEKLSPGSFAGRAQELLALVAEHPARSRRYVPRRPARLHRAARAAAARARCTGAPGTRTRRRGGWWPPGPGVRARVSSSAPQTRRGRHRLPDDGPSPGLNDATSLWVKVHLT